MGEVLRTMVSMRLISRFLFIWKSQVSSLCMSICYLKDTLIITFSNILHQSGKNWRSDLKANLLLRQLIVISITHFVKKKKSKAILHYHCGFLYLLLAQVELNFLFRYSNTHKKVYKDGRSLEKMSKFAKKVLEPWVLFYMSL